LFSLILTITAGANNGSRARKNNKKPFKKNQFSVLKFKPCYHQQ